MGLNTVFSGLLIIILLVSLFIPVVVILDQEYSFIDILSRSTKQDQGLFSDVDVQLTGFEDIELIFQVAVILYIAAFIFAFIGLKFNTSLLIGGLSSLFSGLLFYYGLNEFKRRLLEEAGIFGLLASQILKIGYLHYVLILGGVLGVFGYLLTRYVKGRGQAY